MPRKRNKPESSRQSLGASRQSTVDSQQLTSDRRQDRAASRQEKNTKPVILRSAQDDNEVFTDDNGVFADDRGVFTDDSRGLRDDARASRDERNRVIVQTTLAPVLQLLPYQRRWVEDDSHLKIVVKARQIGYSFAASIRALLECLKRKTTWIFLSKGERQSRLLMEKVQEHTKSCGILARACESSFFEGTLIKQLEVRFANGSVIYGLPANPDTARGYSGNVTLDEFAFHADADKIYAALFPTITRGYCLEVISTPNGQQGKFYELAKAAGLVEQESGVRSQESGGTGSSLVTRH